MSATDEDLGLRREIIEILLSSEGSLDKQAVNRIKNSVCAKYKRAEIPSNADILEAALPEELEVLTHLLQKRPVRTVSGVAVVAVMTSPCRCPHGKCAYCPGGPENGVPQSYTGFEPATMRGLQNEFDPYRQAESRLNQLRATGHSVNKTELIVMGGDWCSKEQSYRECFVKGCLDAMNGGISSDFETAKALNEVSQVRNVGMTFETRPDMITPQAVDDMLRLGATRVEIGVQSLSDSVLKLVERGHDVAATVRATKLLRDSGLKVCYHIMPGLPNTTPEDDLAGFEQLFSDSRFRPDMLKIYPTLVIKGTKLHDWWVRGDYIPYETESTVDLLARAISKMPEYVRIQRMQRDIPLHKIEAGLTKGNLRELVHERMGALGLRDRTIRYREIGHYEMRTGQKVSINHLQFVCRDYEASDGTETFLSFEEPASDVICSFLRLRKPSKDAHRPELAGGRAAIIRELRVYGPVVDIGKRKPGAWQHLGLGEELVSAAERIARKDYHAEQLLVNSGLGVKQYYRDLGFRDTGPYLVKALR
ncbi:MAG: tRNA uridine(34) 5-carboxymethylaminomethyl modification radical SAM/GNAT enzyme Elp3 [Candidatus Thorarchaeota archaeon]|nr:MAG: tRNA uridine(34) 5-carboxymethylaminomethyl modification radical SAM/GNAT enzyme Elp3 [Candidatus Thorarchaeota archaeon]